MSFFFLLLFSSFFSRCLLSSPVLFFLLLFSSFSLPLRFVLKTPTHLGDLDLDLDLDLERRRRCPRSSSSSLSSLVCRRRLPSPPPSRSSSSSPLRLPPPVPPPPPPRSPQRSRLRLRDRLWERSLPLSRRGEEAPSRDRPLLESPAAPFASVGGNGGGGGREGSLSPSSEVMVRERERCYVLRVCGEVGGGACARKKKAAERGGERRKERGELLFFSAVEREKWNQQRQAAPLASHPLRAHLCSLSHPFEEKKTAQVRFFLVVPLLSSRSSCSQRRTSSLPLAPRSLRQRRRESESALQGSPKLSFPRALGEERSDGKREREKKKTKTKR